ncbi:hypothetical protein [Streptomyces sp. SID8352]|uniref:hypothetical protein n=1 Tax=Streptomyces sp. SID8352 TaxID=2690338 RepID=UPI00136DB37D|nr:hypothetical protein [Streptomyces sp. SID8352]MYU24038.1 hypothetical protein [Streptomyces sp. SID8352]
MSTTPHNNPELRALRDRVTAPSSIALPAAGNGLSWKPVTASDIGPILDLKRAAGEIDHPRSLVMRDELEEEQRTNGHCVAARSATSQPSAYGGTRGDRDWPAQC